MGYNIAGTSGKSEFQHHVVVGVCEERPPKEIDFLEMSLAGEIAKKESSIFSSEAGRQVLGLRSGRIRVCGKGAAHPQFSVKS